MNYDQLCQGIEHKQAILPAAYTATITGSEVNATAALKTVTFQINVGTISAADANNRLDFTVVQATTSGGSFSAADSWQYVDTAGIWDKKLDATTEGSSVYRMTVELKAGYPYLKLVGTETGTFSGNLGAICIFHCKKTPTV